MRIISGQARGRKLQTLEGENTRPTLDRTREALFNILQGRVMDARVLDLFAGSGALALEALSRGARSAVLCDVFPAACAVIEKNIAAVRCGERAHLMRCDAETALAKLRGEAFDLIFLDPPYASDLLEKSLTLIAKIDIVTENGIIVCESAAQAELPDLPVPYEKGREYRYGKIKLTLYRRAV